MSSYLTDFLLDKLINIDIRPRCPQLSHPERLKEKCKSFALSIQITSDFSGSAIVTGASRGIGKTIAFDLASRGAKVSISYSSDRSKQSANELISRIESEAHSSAIGVQCNLQDLDAPKQIVEKTLKAFGPHVDILVNNAAVFSDKVLEDVTAEHFDEVFYLNVRAPLFMLQAVLPHLRRPGRVVSISSVAAREGYPGTGTYAGSKGALEAYTRNWAMELGKDGTTVSWRKHSQCQRHMLTTL